MHVYNTFIQKINSGDKKAFRSFFEEMYPSLCRFAANYINDNIHAEDIVQNTFEKFWLIKKDFKQLSEVKYYLFSMVKNSCVNHLRHQRIKKEFESENVDSELYIKNFIIEEEVYQMIHIAIKTLPPRSQNVIMLALAGLKNPEIAEQMNISVNTVKTLKKDAYKKLRFVFSKFIFDD
jgi:RNA polymerase sigma-70 factor (ECF subfamily)